MENLFPSGNFPVTIKTLQNLEEVLMQEVRELGGQDVRAGRRAVFATVDTSTLYKINLCARTALRVFVPIAEFQIRHVDDIYKRALQIQWSQYMDLRHTFAIDAGVNSEMIRHSHYAALKLKDAIADHFRNTSGKRPDVHPDNPDILFHLHIDQHRVTISLDSSGESLNRRGYRLKGAMAPLNEVLAAGMVLLTGWRGESDFYDPMCGSGTIPIEAAMIAMNMPAQALRKSFGFQKWKSFDAATWQRVKKEVSDSIRPMQHKIYASDANPHQLRTAKANIENAGFEEEIEITLMDFFECTPKSEKGILVMNPPYGERLADENINLLYKNMGDRLKQVWSGHQAWIISSNEDAIKRVGLKPSKKIPLINGTLPCRYHRFDLFTGSKRHPATHASGQE